MGPGVELAFMGDFFQRDISRRGFLGAGVKTAAGLAVASMMSARALAKIPDLSSTGWPGDAAPSATQLTTLRAALAQMIPASSTNDWSAADVGTDNYIRRVLAGPEEIFAGGPFRVPDSSLPAPYSTGGFAQFQEMSWRKQRGWSTYAAEQRAVYADGLARIDQQAGGSFAAASAQEQLAILETEDVQGTAFFASLYNHTMEGTYAHPVYRSVDPADETKSDYRPWKGLKYQGDVHGVRYPDQVDPNVEDGPWNVFGGYAPSEIRKPGG